MRVALLQYSAALARIHMVFLLAVASRSVLPAVCGKSSADLPSKGRATRRWQTLVPEDFL